MNLFQEKFTSHFWRVYDKVCRDRDEEDRPPYLKFITILALNIFWAEDVDVAIIEVGIGGEYDCTNIIERPVVTGVTSLGLDHTSLLGHTIRDSVVTNSKICPNTEYIWKLNSAFEK